MKQLSQPRSSAVDAGLDSSYCASANAGRLFIGEARCAHQDQRFALVGGKLGKRFTEFPEFHVAVLIGLGLQRLGMVTVAILDLAAALAIFRAKMVAQDRK